MLLNELWVLCQCVINLSMMAGRGCGYVDSLVLLRVFLMQGLSRSVPMSPGCDCQEFMKCVEYLCGQLQLLLYVSRPPCFDFIGYILSLTLFTCQPILDYPNGLNVSNIK